MCFDCRERQKMVGESKDVVALHRAQEKLRQLRKDKRALIKDLEAARSCAEFTTEARKALTTRKVRSTKRKSKLQSATPILLLSDLHVEELVDPRKFQGFNSFSLDIAAERLDTVRKGFVDRVKLHGAAYNIDSAIIWLGGDMFSGWIHDLKDVTELSPIESVAWLEQHLGAFIDGVLAETNLKKLIVPCSVGNHGRLGEKRNICAPTENSFEWLLYTFLYRRFEKNKRVQFELDTAKLLYLEDVEGYTLRFTHGEELRGVDPFSLRSKTILNWNQVKKAHFTFCGHMHTYGVFKHGVRNGSLIGYNGFAQEIGCEPERPQQAYALIVRGKGLDHHSGITC